jgi:hypothetical protein
VLGFLDRIDLWDDDTCARVECVPDTGVIVVGNSGWLSAQSKRAMDRLGLELPNNSGRSPFTHKLHIMHHLRHSLDIHRRVFPVNPYDIESELGGDTRNCYGGETGEISYQRRNSASVSIGDGFSEAMGLEERGRAVGCHSELVVLTCWGRNIGGDGDAIGLVC